jgi:REP element-mobilizing transposase RayT
MDKFQNKYRIPTNRLRSYDYGANGCYFVIRQLTDTKDSEHYFGEIVVVNDTVNGINIGTDTVETHNYASPYDKTNISTDIVETHNYASLHDSRPKFHDFQPEFQQLPRKIMQLSEIGNIAHQFWMDIPNHFPFVILDEFIIMPDHIHGLLFFDKTNKLSWQPNKFGGQSENLGSVLRGFKSSLKRYANQNNIDFAWQSRYHDSIIRNDIGLENVRKYIVDNPSVWETKSVSVQTP